MIEINGQEDVVEEKDIVGGGGFIVEPDVYDAEVQMAYYGESQSGAAFLDFTFALADGRPFKQRIYFSTNSAKGQETFFLNKAGKKQNLPGYTQCYNMAVVMFNHDPNKELDFNAFLRSGEKKNIMVYDFQAGGEVEKEIEFVYTNLIGKKVKLGLKHIVENKNKKNDENKYVPIAEKREFNEISAIFFPATDLTVVETKSGDTEPAHITKWLDKWKGNIDDRYDDKVSAAPVATESADKAPSPFS